MDVSGFKAKLFYSEESCDCGFKFSIFVLRFMYAVAWTINNQNNPELSSGIFLQIHVCCELYLLFNFKLVLKRGDYKTFDSVSIPTIPTCKVTVKF